MDDTRFYDTANETENTPAPQPEKATAQVEAASGEPTSEAPANTSETPKKKKKASSSDRDAKTFNLSDDVIQAIKFSGLMEGSTPDAIVEAALRMYLKDEIQTLRNYKRKKEAN